MIVLQIIVGLPQVQYVINNSYCFFILFQIASISSRLMSCKALPVLLASSSILVNRCINFLLVRSSAFSASNCKNLAKFINEKKTSPSSSSMFSLLPDAMASNNSSFSSSPFPKPALYSPIQSQPVWLFPATAWPSRLPVKF